MPRASLKERYDNRDVQSQMFDVEKQVGEFPDREKLTHFDKIYDDFKARANEIMYTDTDCVVHALHTYATFPQFTGTPATDEDGANKGYVDDAVSDLKNYTLNQIQVLSRDVLHLSEGEPQTVEGPVTMKSLTAIGYPTLNGVNTYSQLNTFSGGLSASKGSFNGNVSCDDISANKMVTGELTTRGKTTIGGNLDCSNYHITCGSIGASGVITGTFSGSLTGNVSGNTASFSNITSTVVGRFKDLHVGGTLTAAIYQTDNITLSGRLTASEGAFNTSLTCNESNVLTEKYWNEHYGSFNTIPKVTTPGLKPQSDDDLVTKGYVDEDRGFVPIHGDKVIYDAIKFTADQERIQDIVSEFEYQVAFARSVYIYGSIYKRTGGGSVWKDEPIGSITECTDAAITKADSRYPIYTSHDTYEYAGGAVYDQGKLQIKINDKKYDVLTTHDSPIMEGYAKLKENNYFEGKNTFKKSLYYQYDLEGPREYVHYQLGEYGITPDRTNGKWIFSDDNEQPLGLLTSNDLQRPLDVNTTDTTFTFTSGLDGGAATFGAMVVLDKNICGCHILDEPNCWEKFTSVFCENDAGSPLLYGLIPVGSHRRIYYDTTITGISGEVAGFYIPLHRLSGNGGVYGIEYDTEEGKIYYNVSSVRSDKIGGLEVQSQSFDLKNGGSVDLKANALLKGDVTQGGLISEIEYSSTNQYAFNLWSRTDKFAYRYEDNLLDSNERILLERSLGVVKTLPFIPDRVKGSKVLSVITAKNNINQEYVNDLVYYQESGINWRSNNPITYSIKPNSDDAGYEAVIDGGYGINTVEHGNSHCALYALQTKSSIATMGESIDLMESYGKGTFRIGVMQNFVSGINKWTCNGVMVEYTEDFGSSTDPTDTVEHGISVMFVSNTEIKNFIDENIGG